MLEFSEAEIEAAARQLLHEGQFRGWWGEARSLDSHALEKMDPLGRDEFLDLTWRVLDAAAKARTAP